MNIIFVKFIEAVKTGRSDNEILFAMKETHALVYDKDICMLKVKNRQTLKECLVPISNIMYMHPDVTPVKDAKK